MWSRRDRTHIWSLGNSYSIRWTGGPYFDFGFTRRSGFTITSVRKIKKAFTATLFFACKREGRPAQRSRWVDPADISAFLACGLTHPAIALLGIPLSGGPERGKKNLSNTRNCKSWLTIQNMKFGLSTFTLIHIQFWPQYVAWQNSCRPATYI